MVYFESLIVLLSHGVVSIGLCGLILIIVYILNNPKPNSEKNMAYECGFKPFDFTYYPFDVQFYRVGILFLLFDVEILFFFPWVLNFYQIDVTGHVTTILFIALLFFGFIYEVKSEALVWYPRPWEKGISK